MKKKVTIAVILLFISFAFSPSIHANISKDVVEFTTEICGLDGGKQTVELTQVEAEEVDALFKSIRERLNETETREEAEEIFKEAVVELDKYGLLGGLSIKHAQRLVTGGYRYKGFIKFVERLRIIKPLSYRANLLCLVFADAENALDINIFTKLAVFLWRLAYGGSELEQLFYKVGNFLYDYGHMKPFHILNTVKMNAHFVHLRFFTSVGLMGISELSPGPGCWWSLEIRGFTGINILLNKETQRELYLGTALSVHR